ncbi:hypothetical protein [Streptomyces sp. 4N124]
MPALGDRGFHVVSPDYPGFGCTEAPEDFTYTTSTASPRSSSSG